MNAEHRRAKLVALLDKRFKGDRQAFLARSGLTKGRLTQLLDPADAFCERAARGLEKRLGLPKMYFDAGADAVQAVANDGRIMVPVTGREELMLEFFKNLTAEQQETLLNDLRIAADANRVTEKAKGAPIKNHIGNVAMEVAYGLPEAGRSEHPE